MSRGKQGLGLIMIKNKKTGIKKQDYRISRNGSQGIIVQRPFVYWLWTVIKKKKSISCCLTVQNGLQED